MEKTDIIIPTCKSPEQVKPQIDEILSVTEHVRIIATCQPVAAAINRNIGLDFAASELMVMMDDDITDFYPGWIDDLLRPILHVPDMMIISARLIQPKGLETMGASNHAPARGIFTAENNRVSTGCIGLRRNKIRFNERFHGSGYEDTAYCQDIKRTYGTGKIWVTNECVLTHLNEMKNQGGENWEHNKKLYLELNPDDESVEGQTDWTV